MLQQLRHRYVKILQIQVLHRSEKRTGTTKEVQLGVADAISLDRHHRYRYHLQKSFQQHFQQLKSQLQMQILLQRFDPSHSSSLQQLVGLLVVAHLKLQDLLLLDLGPLGLQFDLSVHSTNISDLICVCIYLHVIKKGQNTPIILSF